MSKKRHLMAVAAHLVLENDHGELLFLRRANTGYADGQWSVPAGHVEAGETLAAACVRETLEEIGLVLELADLKPRLVQHKHDTDGQERIDVFFWARLPALGVPTIGEPTYCDGLGWYSPTRPPQPLIPYIAAALEALQVGQNLAVAYFGFAEEVRP